jgi:DNA-binding NarL/FixJ family response regulator
VESHPSKSVDDHLPSSKRVLLVEDEDFTRAAVASFLESMGYGVHAVATAAEALEALDTHDPHAMVTDLDLGPGPSGVDLAQRVIQDRPWVGLVILTAHQSVHLAVGGPGVLPAEAITIVKSSLDSMQDISEAVEQSILQVGKSAPVDIGGRSHVVVSTVQAEILRMMAEGLSNAGIAERRGTTLRAAEASVQRTLQALGINADPHLNSRVLAVRMWQAGQVTVR